jgi:hypothetical protein
VADACEKPDLGFSETSAFVLEAVGIAQPRQFNAALVLPSGSESAVRRHNRRDNRGNPAGARKISTAPRLEMDVRATHSRRFTRGISVAYRKGRGAIHGVKALVMKIPTAFTAEARA